MKKINSSLENLLNKYGFFKIYIIASLFIGLLYFINPIIALIGIIPCLFIIFLLKEEVGLTYLLVYIILSSFFGVTILGMKLYDIFIVVVFIKLFILISKNKIRINKIKRKTLIIATSYVAYLIVIFFLKNPDKKSFLELIRYGFSYITFIVFLFYINSKNQIEKFIGYSRTIGLGYIILAITMFVGSRISSEFRSVENLGIIKITLFNTANEFRITGFFSDPNKLFSYFIILLVVYEVYNFYFSENMKLIDKNNIIFFIGIFISFSRTGIMMMICYLLLKIIAVKILKKDQGKNRKVFISLIVLGGITFILFNKQIMYLLDELLIFVTKLMGREEAFIYSPSISESSRLASSKVALESIKDSPFIGVGLNKWKNFYYMPPHNSFVSIIQESGFVGLVLFGTLFLNFLKKIPIHILGTLIFLPMLTLDLQNYRLNFVLLAMIIGGFNYNRNFRGEKNESYYNRSCKYR